MIGIINERKKNKNKPTKLSLELENIEVENLARLGNRHRFTKPCSRASKVKEKVLTSYMLNDCLGFQIIFTLELTICLTINVCVII